MRRYLFLILFIAVLVTPFVLRAYALRGSRATAAPVSADASRLVIETPHVEGIRREFAEAFNAWHIAKYGKAVNIDYRTGGTTDIIKYLEASREAYKALGSYNGVDLVWGGGDIFFNQMKGEGFFQGLQLPPGVLHAAFPNPDLGGLPLYDTSTPPQWYGTALSSFGIGFNRDVAAYLGTGEPKTWRDLADPRWRGWIVMADPTRSSSSNAVYMTIVQRAMQDALDAGSTYDAGWANGMGLLRQIAANARLFTDASASLPVWVASGDVGAAMTIDFHSRSEIAAVGDARMGYIEPVNATTINPDPIAMVQGAPDHDTAEHFVEFLLGGTAQKLWNVRAGRPGGPKQTSLRRLPIVQSVYADLSDFTDPINPFTAAASFNTKKERTATYTFLPYLIQVSCIDPLAELQAAREAITKAGRADLDAELGRFPFDQKEALTRAAKLKSLDAQPAQKLALLRQWTEDFRSEYRQLKAETGQ